MPDDERRHDSRPHFVLPYWLAVPGVPGDDGNTRPLPGNVVFYLCPSIHASPYAPGEDLTVTVDVANYGGANTPSQAQVTVWWADPTTGFVIDPQNLIGYRTVAVDGRGGLATTQEMKKRIPPTAPPHICLLARVSHQYDRAGTIADPVGDRHWAQRNLSAVAAQPGVPVVFPFMAGNPLEEEVEFLVSTQFFDERHLGAIASAIGAEPTGVDALIAITDSEALRPDGQQEFRLSLQGREQRRLFFHIMLQSELAPGQFAGFQLAQLDLRRERLTGGIGVVLKGLTR